MNIKANYLKVFAACIVVISLFASVQVSGQSSDSEILKREIKIKKGQKYLNLPVNNSDKLVKLTIKQGETPLDRFTINLAENEPEFWTFFEVSSYEGKTLTLIMEKAPARFPGFGGQKADDEKNEVLNANGLNKIFADITYPGMDSTYKEAGRPQVHFTASRGWINDPNGLIYHNGLYHLYFQHNPYGWQWGNMHWGHAVSSDLMHWKQLSEAIYPFMEGETNSTFNLGDAAFSGSAVTDPENTAGFRKNNINPIIAVYTSTGRGECLKMSYDEGKTFTDYPGNPVLVHDGRDPKVFWYEPGNYWVMVVWDSGQPKKLSMGAEANVRQHSIYTSPDLKNWTYQSGVSGFFECPEFFELPVENEPGLSKWVMYDAHGRYMVGDFDGKKFIVEQNFTKYENGGGYFYASQTFNNAPDGRRIQVGWGRNINNQGMPFNQPQLFPTELKLKKISNGYRLCPTPIEEVKGLFKNTQKISNKIVQSGESAGLSVDASQPLHIVAEIERGNAAIVFNILGYELKYDNEWMFSTAPPKKDGEKSERTPSPFAAASDASPVIYAADSEIFKIEAMVDKNILEFFINDGELYYVTAFNGAKETKVEASVQQSFRGPMFGGRNLFVLKRLEIHELKSIW